MYPMLACCMSHVEIGTVLIHYRNITVKEDVRADQSAVGAVNRPLQPIYAITEKRLLERDIALYYRMVSGLMEGIARARAVH